MSNENKSMKYDSNLTLEVRALNFQIALKRGARAGGIRAHTPKKIHTVDGRISECYDG